MQRSPTTEARPAVVTEDPDLLAELLRLCAAAGVTADVADHATRRQLWGRASTVLIGADQAAPLARLALPRRDHVLLVTNAGQPDRLWSTAVDLHADRVLVLPADQPRLIAHLSDLADGGAHGVTVGVVGGSGGAGASTLAAALALTGARSGSATLLIDADPLGGGLELLLGCEQAAGLRWPDVASTQGRVSAAAFRAALPMSEALPVLSWDRGARRRTVPAVMETMVAAARRGAALVVMDLPRRLDDPATEAVQLCDTVLLVVTSDVRGVSAARCVAPDLGRSCPSVRVVVREVPGSDLAPATVADMLGLELAGVLPTRRSIARSVDSGLGPLGRGGLERRCRALLTTLPIGTSRR